MCFDGVDYWLVAAGVVGEGCDAVSFGFAGFGGFGDAF